ncbi:MAG: glycine cleavage system aminomethyltransferase GcvT [Limisphaerales bacterium]
MKRTPLFAAHQRLGGKLIEFGGWEMPVQYTSITDEHLAVRHAAGLFDISHMGEVWIEGPQAESFLNQVLTNDLRKLAPGHGQYTLMCNEQGGVIDDLYAYRLGPAEYLLVINASRIPNDVAWLREQLSRLGPGASTGLLDASDATGAVAVQGPKVAAFINQCLPGPFTGGAAVGLPTDLKKNQVARAEFAGRHIWVSRTGYTGEDGFEIVAPGDVIEAIWNRLLDLGRPHGLKPAGLGARDTLRTEACYPLYGHELNETTTPLEAGLGFFVALNKGEFTGRPVLAEQKLRGVRRKLVAFKMAGKSAPPRPHYPVWSQSGAGERIGQVSSGTQSPSLGIGLGMACLPSQFAQTDTPLAIEIRGQRAAALVVPKPFYRKPD